MTGATSKCICGVQPPDNDLTTIFVCYFLHVRSSVHPDLINKDRHIIIYLSDLSGTDQSLVFSSSSLFFPKQIFPALSFRFPLLRKRNVLSFFSISKCRTFLCRPDMSTFVCQSSFLFISSLSIGLVMNMVLQRKKHRKNCECCPGHYLIVDHYSSI